MRTRSRRDQIFTAEQAAFIRREIQKGVKAALLGIDPILAKLDQRLVDLESDLIEVDEGEDGPL